MSETEDQMEEQAIANSKAYLTPAATAALTIDALHDGSMEVRTLMRELKESFARVKNDNLLEVEAMLLSQAQTLNVFFHRCLSRVSDLDMLHQIQIFSDLAMKAQNHSRKTLLALAEIKNPKRATFIKQQNNALGNQQVNNSENLKNSANELLETKDEQQRLDIRATFETIPENPPMETVEISRSKNCNRKKNQSNERVETWSVFCRSA